MAGNKDTNYLVIDPTASGNRMIGVAGAMEFYGITPSHSWSKLAKIANVGDG